MQAVTYQQVPPRRHCYHPAPLWYRLLGPCSPQGWTPRPPPASSPRAVYLRSYRRDAGARPSAPRSPRARERICKSSKENLHRAHARGYRRLRIVCKCMRAGALRAPAEGCPCARTEHHGPPRTRCQPSGPCRVMQSRMICSVVSRSNRTTASPSASGRSVHSRDSHRLVCTSPPRGLGGPVLVEARAQVTR